MGLHSSSTCELTFGLDGDCDAFIVGKEGEGMKNMFLLMNEARLICAGQGESQANLSMRMAEQYASERVQFGESINKLPDIKRMLLISRAKARGLRTLMLYTANLFDKKLEKNNEDLIAFLTPICKAYGSEEGFNVCVTSLQIYGGYGYCTEYGIEQFVRDSKVATIYEGTNGIQAIDFVNRKILKDEAKALYHFGNLIQDALKYPEAKEWGKELELMDSYLRAAAKMVEEFSQQAKAGKINSILTHCSDYLQFCGHLLTGWLLLEGACLSKKLMDSANGDEKLYYETKINDFKVFVRHVMAQNSGLATTILNFDDSIVDMEI